MSGPNAVTGVKNNSNIVAYDELPQMYYSVTDVNEL